MTPICVTMGDPRGIGPEIVAKAIAKLGPKGIVVVGDADLLVRIARKIRLPHRSVNVLHIGARESDGGVAYVAAAHELAMRGDVSAIVTGPMRKLAPFKKGGAAPGHTELLSKWTGTTPPATLLMVSPRLKVSLVTNHVPIARVSKALTREAVSLAIRRTHDALVHWFGVKKPRLAVLGLNPHAGEDGKIGDEDAKVIAPAIASARKKGIRAEGPLPADSAMHQVRAGRWDACVAMYHDQGLIAAKLDGFGDAVNVSLGLPYIRTSVDHGTAYDIVGKGIADPASLVAALELARRLAHAQ